MALQEIEADVPALPEWRHALPELTSERVIVRELRLSDAPALHRVASMAEIVRHTWPPPATIEACERFINWTSMKRARGDYICFGIVPRDGTEVAGIFELRSFHPMFFRAELGFVLHPAWWGTGLFGEAARLVCDFAFTELGVHRIEARASAENRRGNAALRKIGARKEGRLHAAFISDGRYVDQYLWAIVNDQHRNGTASRAHAPDMRYGAA
jgi:ribosomal-protein-alanine N-acetyltransferase